MSELKKRRSRKAHRDKRQSPLFIGRQEPLERFRCNLKLPPEDWLFLFSISGQGGVGKTTLLRQFRKVAESEGCITSCTNDVETSVLEAMGRIAKDFENQGYKLKRFSERYRTYQQKREELESDPEAPHGFISLIGTSLAKASFGLAKQIPGSGLVTPFVDEEMLAAKAGEWSAYFLKKHWNTDEVLLVQKPIKVLTPIFLEEIYDVSEKANIILFFDTYERTSRFLNDWLWEVVENIYGDLPLNLIIVTAGREELERTRWIDYSDLIARCPLEPFSPDETKQYLIQQGITNPKIIDLIIHLSGCLPILVATLATKSQDDPTRIFDASSTAVNYFLSWIDDLKKRRVALESSLSRLLNRDIIAILHGEDSADELFSWLTSMPFVEVHRDGWSYHEIVRTQMIRQQRLISPRTWLDLQGKLANYYDKLCFSLNLDSHKQWHDPKWQTYRLHRTYHTLCQSFTQKLPEVLSDFLIALKYQRQFATQYAELIVLAGAESESSEIYSIGEQILKGLKAFDEGQYENGIGMFSLILTDYEIEPESKAVALSWRGEAYRLMRQYNKAIQDFSNALEIKPDDVWTIVCRSSAYRKSGRHEESLRDCNTAIKIDSKNSWAFNSRGETYLRMRCYEEALRDFSFSIELNPDNAWSVASRGKAYRIMRRSEAALEDFNRAIELNPSSSWTLANRGLTHRQIGNFQNSLEDFNRAIELEPNSGWAIASRGETYRQLNRYDEALKDFDRAIELYPNHDWALCRRAEIHLFLKAYDKALSDFAKTIEFSLNNDWRRFTYSLALKAAGQLNAAKENLVFAIQIAQQRQSENPQNYRTCLTLALYHLADDNLALAQQLYQNALSQELSAALIQEALRGLEDFLNVFPNHQLGTSIRQQLLERRSKS